MPDDQDEKEAGIHRVDTVPPPPGEDDAYSAPTKVGAMPASVLEAMKKAAIDGQPLKPLSLPKTTSSSAPPPSHSKSASTSPPPAPSPVDAPTPFPVLEAAPAPPEIVRIANEEVDEGEPPTTVFRAAQKTQPRPPAASQPPAEEMRAPPMEQLPYWAIVVLVLSVLVALGTLAVLIAR